MRTTYLDLSEYYPAVAGTETRSRSRLISGDQPAERGGRLASGNGSVAMRPEQPSLSTGRLAEPSGEAGMSRGLV
jgi:hypothetical protein